MSLLGLNPSWIQFQSVNDALAATVAGATPADILRAHRIRKGFTDDQRDTLDLLSGHGGVTDILHSTNALTGSAAILAANPVYRRFLQGHNPLTALIRADAARTTLFREAVVLKRLASTDASITALRPLQARLQSSLAHADPKALADALKGPAAADAARHVVKIMGDFTSYTAAERRFLRRMAPFYGFLRYSVRLSLYTLPVEHPLIGLLLAEIGKTSAEEQKAILGGRELPYALGALYNKDGTRKSDFARASPFGNPLTGTSSISQFAGALVPPVALPIADALYGSSAFKGNRSYSFGGESKPTQGSDLTPSQRASIWLSEMLGLVPPVRLIGKVTQPAGGVSTGDNFGVFGSTPLKKPREGASTGKAQRAQQAFLPLLASSQPTDDKAIAASNRKFEKKRLPRKRGGGGSSAPGFGGGAGSAPGFP